jgi:hypothetical protein
LPSSFNTVRSNAWVCSTSPPVSVSGTVYDAGAVSRKTQTAPSIQSEETIFGLRHGPAGGGMLTPFPSAAAFALALGARLTLRGLTLRRNPWTFGVRGSHPHLRYSCQHSHFRYLHNGSRRCFAGLRSAPLPRQKTVIRNQLSQPLAQRPESRRAIARYSLRQRSATSAPTSPRSRAEIAGIEAPYPHRVGRTDGHDQKATELWP